MASTYQNLNSTPKYICQNGRVLLNPNYNSGVGNFVPSAPPPSYEEAMKRPLTTVSSLQDQMEISDVTNLGVPQKFQDTLTAIQAPTFVSAYDAKGVDGGTLVDGLNRVFQQNEIPIGLMSKLTAFKGAKLHFKIDDSGSMSWDSNLKISDFSPYMRKKVGDSKKQYASRWQEAEDRLHILMELLAYIPTDSIVLSFFDRDKPGKQIILDRKGKSPEAFIGNAHKAIDQFFNKIPDGGTPILANLTNMLEEADRTRGNSDIKTMHYLLSDGEPSGAAEEIRRIKNLLRYRNAASNPVTFLSCSNDRKDYAWMHEVEEIAPFVAALPDFKDEQMEVYRDQGSAFPYSKGMWILCNVAAAINPDDLDALDQHMPFTKATLENLLGRGLMDSEYQQYFDVHPNARRIFGPDYQLFLKYPMASAIPSVRLFQDTLKAQLNRDMDNDEDDTEDRDVTIAEQAVLNSRQRRYGTMFDNTAAGLGQPPYPQSSANNSDCCSCTIL